MGSGRSLVRLALAGTCVAAAALFAATGLADATFPELDVFTYDQQLGVASDLSLDLQLVPTAPKALRAVITVPEGYGAVLNALEGTQLGGASIDAVPDAGGQSVTFDGNVVVTSAAAFAADPVAQSCAPGTHLAGWHLVLSGPSTLVVPIAVDQPTVDGPYTLTMCLDPLQTAAFKPTDVYFLLRGVFTNPSTSGIYAWRALVTPLGATGQPDPGLAFDLQGDEPLPEILTSAGQYDIVHKVLTLRGHLYGGGYPRVQIRIHMYAGKSLFHLQEIGVAVTTRNGSYLFRKRLTKKPAYTQARVFFYHGPTCTQPSTAPAGCAGWSIDGTDSPIGKVITVKIAR